MEGSSHPDVGFSPRKIASANYRGNPNLELRPFNSLPFRERHTLRGLADDPDFYGLLTSRESTAPAQLAVSCETALLFLSLREPGKLPSYLTAAGLDTVAALVPDLVLGGVLEIECDGKYVSGAEAHRYLGSAPVLPAKGRLAQLSSDALAYAEALESTDVLDLAARLYCYNTLPISTLWHQRLPKNRRVRDYVELDSPESRALRRHWRMRTGPSPSSEWLTYEPRNSVRHMAGINHRYKLYISPAPEDLVTALGGLVETLLRQGPTVFKVGADLHGMLRPDKLVVYFTTRERLFSVARNLGERIGSCRPHGVPFTAELEGEGLISWAVDPPSESVRSLWDPRRHSWRSWLALELASGFAATVGTRDRDIEAQAFALDRLERLGVDTSTWTLACAPWRDEVSPSGNQL